MPQKSPMLMRVALVSGWPMRRRLWLVVGVCCLVFSSEGLGLCLKGVVHLDALVGALPHDLHHGTTWFEPLHCRWFEPFACWQRASKPARLKFLASGARIRMSRNYLSLFSFLLQGLPSYGSPTSMMVRFPSWTDLVSAPRPT